MRGSCQQRLLALAVLSATVLAACGGADSSQPAASTDGDAPGWTVSLSPTWT